MRRSKRAKQYGVGLCTVATTVMASFVSALTSTITCAGRDASCCQTGRQDFSWLRAHAIRNGLHPGIALRALTLSGCAMQHKYQWA